MGVMHRPAIQPLHIGATAPETLSIMQQHLLVAEEQTEALFQDMGSLGVPRERLLDSSASLQGVCQRPVSPVRVWPAVGGVAAQQRSCEALVSRMCRLESILHSLKLATFRLETERQLNPSNAARVTEQLAALQKESEEAQREARKELLQVQDQLWQACQEREEALEEAQKLREELEVATTSKMDVALAAEELKVIKLQMTEKLLELKSQLSEEADCRLEAQQTHNALLLRVKEMEEAVELERERVRVLQTDCQTLQCERQDVRQALKKEEERAGQLEKRCRQLQGEADAKDSIVSRLTDELKSAHLALRTLQQENSRLQKRDADLKTAAEKVQGVNVLLESQCSELNATLRSLTVENARLLSEHQAQLKAERERVLQQLQEQDLLLDAARRNIQAELQGALKDRLGLQQDLDALRRDHEQLQQSSRAAREAANAQRERLESTVERLQVELNGAVKEGEAVKREKDRMLAEAQNKVSKLEKERSSLKTQLTKANSREVQLQLQLSSQAEHKQERNSVLEKKYAKASAELSSWKLKCQELEQNLREVQTSLERREKALDYQALRDQMESLQEPHRNKQCQLEAPLGVRCQGGDWVAQTLHGMLASHARLKSSTDALQAELAGREDEVIALQKERVEIQQDVERLQNQVAKLQQDLIATDAEMEPLRKALESVSLDNKQLAHTLEQALLANNQLVGRLSRAQDQKESIQSQYQQLLSQREAELKDTREEAKWLAHHLESVKEQLKQERACQRRASHRELTGLKKGLEEATSRSGDLSRANRELREKVGELEKVVSNQKGRIKDLSSQLKQYVENRAAMASSLRVKEMEEAVKGLESLKEEYQRRNNEQSQLIQQFQSELQRLTSSQEGELETEREHRQVLQDKCQTLEENVRRLRQSRDEAEERLREASVESQQITENLIEAHSWFRSNFRRLKNELEKTKRKKEPAMEKLGSLGNAKEGTLDTSSDRENEDQSGQKMAALRQNRWSGTTQRWETKRELAHASGRRGLAGRADRPTHRRAEK